MLIPCKWDMLGTVGTCVLVRYKPGTVHAVGPTVFKLIYHRGSMFKQLCQQHRCWCGLNKDPPYKITIHFSFLLPSLPLPYFKACRAYLGAWTLDLVCSESGSTVEPIYLQRFFTLRCYIYRCIEVSASSDHAFQSSYDGNSFTG
jgi:hypothetical protein